MSEFNDTLTAIRKQYGEATFHVASRDNQPERIGSGVFMLDFALLGGYPHNRITMIAGERHSGKTTLADLAIAQAQRMFPTKTPVYIDVEGTHDTVWAKKLGVNTDKLYVFKPETGESAIDVTDALVRTQETSLIVVDSIAALVPMKETESSVEDQTVGLQARLVGTMVRKVTSGLIAERNRGHYVTVILLNQFRSKIGGYGVPRVLPGGRALEFATSVQMIIKNKEKLGKDEYDVENVEENEHSFDIKKNKLNAGPRTGEFRMRRIPHPLYSLAEGQMDEVFTMLAFAKKFGFYSGGGSRWTLDFWNVSKEYRGLNDASQQLYSDPETYNLLRNHLIYKQAEHLGMPDYFLNRFLPKLEKKKESSSRVVRTRTR